MIKCMYLQSLNVWGGINHILHHCYSLSLMHIKLHVISTVNPLLSPPSQIRPPSLISPPFSERKFNKPPSLLSPPPPPPPPILIHKKIND